MTHIAVVTGVAGSIGSAVARHFREEGWRVVGVDRSSQRDCPVVTDSYVEVDLSEPGTPAQVAATISEFGYLNCLVNNAAVQANAELVDTSLDLWRSVLAVNLEAPFQLIRELHELLKAGSGSVVNIGSVHSVATSSGLAAYAISKGALASLTRTAAIELARDGIRCNALLPGAVMTPMLRAGLDRRPDDGVAELAARIPLGFVAEPADIAPTVLHLADNRVSRYITGQSIVVDGGVSVRLASE